MRARGQHRSRASSTEELLTLTQDRRAELLAGCPLFRGIDADGLAKLAALATSVDFPAGHVIARQGEIGTGFFVIVSGAVRVVRDGTVVARLGPGEFFGELSVLDRMPRNATVAAEEPTSCLALASWDFENVLLEEPALTLAILRGVAMRLREVTESARH
jgi:CRP-like cAMP-binding protein